MRTTAAWTPAAAFLGAAAAFLLAAPVPVADLTDAERRAFGTGAVATVGAPGAAAGFAGGSVLLGAALAAGALLVAAPFAAAEPSAPGFVLVAAVAVAPLAVARAGARIRRCRR